MRNTSTRALGATVALLAAVASGSIGPGRLAEVGPAPGAVALAVGLELLVGAAIALFGAAVVLSMLGIMFGGWILDRMSDVDFKRWTRWLVTGVGVTYLVQAAQLYLRA